MLTITVAKLAQAIENRISELSNEELLMLHILQEMPHYARAHRLDAWEAAYKSIRHELDKEPLAQIDAVFELGAHNLYAKFEQSQTEQLFYKVKEGLASLGVSTPKGLRVSEW